MIEFTIKTLDSFNHNFSVEDETTVSQLKERIRDELGIEISMQRLIFCGRVMQDHHRLAEYDVDGKVVHLVQRAPPSPQRRTGSQSAQREREREPHANPGIRHHIRHLWSINPPTDLAPEHAVASMTPTSGRLDFIRRTIQDIRHGLTGLRAEVISWDNGDRAEVPVEPMETDTADTATPNAAPNEGEGEDEYDLDEEIVARAATARRRIRGARAIRSRYTRPRDLGQLIEELDLLHDEFAPYRTSYVRMLRATNVEYSEDERAHRQRMVELVCDIMHSFAHAFHAVSDITLHVGQRYPRLSSEPPVNRHPIPMQAHINVVQTNRRPAQQGNNDNQNSTSTTTGTGGGTATATATPTANATNPPPTATDNNQPNPGIRVNQTNATPGRNTTQPNFNINIQPEPVTYQVEIETRVPIAVPIDNILLNGLAAVANSLHQEHIQNHSQQGQGQGQGQTAAGLAAGQTLPQGQAQAQPLPTRPGQGQQGQGQTQNQNQGQANRTRVLMDIENLLRGLSQGNGVEVVMSMEELPHPPASFGGIHMQQSNIPTAQPNFQHPGGNLIYPGESGVIVTPVFAPNPLPTAEILQNVLSNVLRPTFGEGMAYFSPGQAQMRTFPMNTQNQTGGQGQTQGQFQNTGTQAQGGQTQTSTAGQTQIPGVQIPGVQIPGVQIPGVQIPTVLTFGQPQGFIGQAQGFFGHTQPAGGQTQPAGGQTQATGAQTQVVGGYTQVPGGRTQTAGGQTQTAGGQAQATGAQTQEGGGQTQATTGLAGGPTLGTGDSNQPQQPGGQTGSNAGQNQQSRNFRQGFNAGTRGRVVNSRTHAFPITCMVYDRYMHCDSQFARRHLQERRETYQELAEAEARDRASRLPPPDIDTLRQRNHNFTERHMAIMMRLLSGPVTLEGGLNAFMVTVARHLFIEHRTLNSNDAPPIPSEFASIRDQLRDYVSDLLETAIERSARTNPFEAVTERLITQFSDFLNNLPNLTRMNPNVDPTTTVRVMIRSRLPAIIACVMSESSSDMFAARFYNVFARFFIDLCTIFQNFFLSGFNALLMVYDLFIERITEGFEETAREWLRLLSRENLIAIRNDLESNLNSVRQYFRRADGSMLPVTLCCMYQAEQQGISVEDRTYVNLPHICDRHQRMTMPLQAPPLLPPPENFTSNDSATSTPETVANQPEQQAQPAEAEERAETPEESCEAQEDDSSQSTVEPEPETPQPADNQTPEPSSPDKEKHAPGDSTSSTMTPYENESRSPKEMRSQGTSPMHLVCTCPPPTGEGSAGVSLRQEPSETESSRSTPDSMRIVPPVILLQHWGEEWVPVFARDQRVQRERERDQPPEPYSDGYLAGMPSRKRRCVRQSRPPTTLDGFMNESIREATERTTTFDQQELRGVFRESVRTMVRNRASNSEDYDPVRYSSAARFMDQAKANDSEKKSKSQDSMD